MLAVTIATNMAGRGTDIQLGGNVEMRVLEALAADPMLVKRLRRIRTTRQSERAQARVSR